jgi:alpha-mannosidase
VTLAAETADTPSRTTRVTLTRESERIDIDNEIGQNFGDTHHWGFGFNIQSPDVWHEEVGAIIRAKLDTQGGHYSSRTQVSRYDYLTLNHFTDMSGGGVGVTLSNADCYFMKLGNSQANTLDVSTPQISVLAGGKVAYNNTGISNQGGDSHFLQRFSIQTHDAFDPVTAMKLALEHQNPLVTGPVTGTSGDYPPSAFSLLQISNPNVLLWALKPAEEGIDRGLIARVWNLSPDASNFVLSLNGWTISSAEQVTHIETDIESTSPVDGALSETLSGNQIKTFLLKPSGNSTGISKWMMY